MKKKLAMRIASLALCVVFTGMLFGAPKSKAVVTEISVGTAALASYMTATGIPLTVINGGASTVTAGVASMASSYATATGAASSGSAFLSSLAAGVSISPAGAIVLTAAAVVAIGALVAWYVRENELENPGDAALLSGIGVALPDLPATCYDYMIVVDWSYSFGSGIYLISTANGFGRVSDGCLFGVSSTGGYERYLLKSGVWELDASNYNDANWYAFQLSDVSNPVLWTNVALYNTDGSVYLAASDFADAKSQLEVVRTPEFTQPDIELSPESQKQMVIDAGFAPGTTLDTVIEQVPELIIAGDFAPTYEINTVGAGEGTDTETKPDEETGIYIPVLSEIKSILGGLADAVAQAIAKIFTPSQEAVDNLASEVDTKLPFIPVLKDFGSDLVYNLEHPEKCADGIGLTTVVDLGKGRGTYLGDTTHDLLDVSWYLEYKPLVDDLIVGFCWLVFLWNCYGALPRIIHGEGSTITVHAREFSDVGAGSGKKALGDGK